jgi:MoaA/NifB/PqqE/SkfB family radical SAM enzyme
MGLFDRLLHKKNLPSLDWIQVEVTSLCNSSCFYCARTVYKDRWRNGSMSLETFTHLATSFKMAGLIFLQGWGEPFLNKRLLEMIEIAKKSGCKVGLTTNGMLLDPQTMDHLIDLGLDILGISLAGTRPETHNRLREGTDLKRITQSLIKLKEKKAGKNALLPEVHLAYIMLRSNFEDLSEIINYAEKVGSKDIVCSNLNFFQHPELQKETIFLDTAKRDYYEETLTDLRARARENGIDFFFYRPFLPDSPLPVCPENILRSCYVSHDGSVSSCVFTNIPISGKEGLSGLPRSITYGNINDQSLLDIWNSNAYKSFRHIFEIRQQGIKEDVDLVIDAVRAQVGGQGKMGTRNGDRRGILPDQCRNCYRMWGV